MLSLLQTLVHVSRIWVLCAICVFIPTAGSAASAHLAVAHSACIGVGVAAVPKLNMECILFHMDIWTGLRLTTSGVARPSKQESFFTALELASPEARQISTTFLPGSIPKQSGYADHYLSALPNQMASWDRNNHSVKCCVVLHPRPPHLEQPSWMGTVMVLSFHTLFGLMFYCSVLSRQILPRLPHWTSHQRSRRRPKLARPFRLMPRQQVQYGKMAWPRVVQCGQNEINKPRYGILSCAAS